MANTKDKTEAQELRTKRKIVIKTDTPLNLFASAVVVPTGKAKKKEQETTRIKGPEFSKLLKSRSKENAKLKASTETKEGYDKEIKNLGLTEFKTLITENDETPKNLILEADNGMKMTYYPGGNFRKIETEEEAKELMDKYGDSVIESKEMYVVNPTMVDLYSSAISRAIAGSSEIAEEHKKSLIQKIETFSVAKDLMTRIPDLITKDITIEQIMSDFKPSMSIKEPTVPKSAVERVKTK